MPDEECPFCGGRTEVDREDLIIRGISYGEYEVVRCLECDETIYPTEVWDLMQEVLATPRTREDLEVQPDVIRWDVRGGSFSWPHPGGSVTASFESRVPGEPSPTAA